MDVRPVDDHVRNVENAHALSSQGSAEEDRDCEDRFLHRGFLSKMGGSVKTSGVWKSKGQRTDAQTRFVHTVLIGITGIKRRE